MISYQKLFESIFKLFIVSYLFFFLSIATPLGGITIDRFLSLMIFLTIIIKFKHRFDLFGITILSLIAYVTLFKLYYINELNPKYFMFLICMIILYNSYRINKLNLNFHKYIVFSYLLLSLICIYSIYSFLTSGIVPSSFKFLDSISFIRTVDYEHMRRVNASYLFPRLALPWSTPPHLSLVLAIYSLYFLKRFFETKSKLNFIFLLSSVFFMLTTISRSGIAPFLLISFIYYNISSNTHLIKNTFKLTIFFALFLFCLKIFNDDLFQLLFNRFFVGSLENMTEGHTSARIFGINQFIEGSVFEMFFGVGIGNFVNIHAHMTTLTFLVEIGIIGVSLFMFLFIQRAIICYKFYKKFPNNSKEHIFELMLLMLVFIAMLLYEFTYLTPVYLFWGMATARSYNESQLINLK